MPFWALAGAALIAGTAVIVAVQMASSASALGIRVAPGAGGRGIRVDSVAVDGPANGILRPGDRIEALAGPSGPWLRLQSGDAMREPDNLPGFTGYNRFRRRQRELSRILAEPVVRVLLVSGAVLRVQPARRRSWTSLPPGFWLLAGFGVLAFLIAAAVWGSASGVEMRLPARLLGFSGAGFLLTAVGSAVYIERELALDPDVFRALELVNQAGILLFAICGAALLWCYPRRLTRFPLHWLMIAVGVLVWLNLLFQWHDLPVHNVYIPLFAAYLLAVGFSLVQWRWTRGDPLARAALKWLMLSIFLTTGVALTLFFVPVVFGFRPLSSAVATGGIGLLMFVGLAAGVARYRLFDLERWWFDIWLWFLAGAAVLVLDALFVLALDIVPLHAFGLAVVLIAWLYVPFRGRLWKSFSSDASRWWERHLPETLETVFSASNRAEFIQRWVQFLRRMFRPLIIQPSEDPAERAQVLDNGVRLRVPPLGAGATLDLQYQQRGTRLFTRDDARLADTLVALATRSLYAFEARERSVARERERIMRDLHDDVGAHLLTLVRRCREPRDVELASTALATLRDIVHSLSLEAARTLPEALSDWRGEIAERLEEADVELEWRIDGPLPEIPLGGRRLVHLRRIFQEGVTNLLKHSGADHAQVSACFENERLRLAIVNDGVRPERYGVRGHGLGNIAKRAVELGGCARHGIIEEKGTEYFRLEVEVPLTEEGIDREARVGG